MPNTVRPILEQLTQQLSGVLASYQRMLDDEFLFAAATQVPQAATLFDLVAGQQLPFADDTMTLPELLALIAYRYGFTGVRRIGHGGYAVVLGHDTDSESRFRLLGQRDPRRVMRLVPDHHVQDVTGTPDRPRRFDVGLDSANEPLRHPDYPLLLSDLFLLPRHTTRLVFHDASGAVRQAGGKPAILHCQLLPEVIPLNAGGLSQRLALAAGNLLEAGLAALGVSVADAHGGNGGVLVGRDGQPLTFKRHGGGGDTQPGLIPVVLDYGYYSEIGAKKLAGVLLHNGVTHAQLRDLLTCADLPPDIRQHCLGHLSNTDALAAFTAAIGESTLPREAFGRLLYRVEPLVLRPDIWISYSDQHWQTIKEKTYPPLHDQSRLNTLYPAYDEILFPQRIEEYHFTL